MSLAPHLTELLYAAGAGDLAVGALEYSNYPDAARRLPRVGSEVAIDLEAVAALAPDLILAWPQSGSRRALERLAALGVPQFRSEPRALEDIARTLERFGTLTGRTASASAAADAFRARLAQLRERYSGRATVRVFHQVWSRPLMTLNGEHVVSKVIALCGGENVFAQARGIAPIVNRESVLAADPEAILTGGIESRLAELVAGWRAFPALTAVARGNLFVVPPELIHQHTPRILDGAERVCAALDAARARRP